MTTQNTFFDSVLSAKIPFRLAALPNITITKLDTGKLIQNVPGPFGIAPNLNINLNLDGLEIGNYFSVLLVASNNGPLTMANTVIINAMQSGPSPITLTVDILIQHAILQTSNRLATTVNNTVVINPLTSPVAIGATSFPVTGLKLDIYVIDKTSTTINLRMMMSEAAPYFTP